MTLDQAERAQVVARLKRLDELINDLEHMVSTAAERANIRDRMRREIDATRKALRILTTHDRH